MYCVLHESVLVRTTISYLTASLHRFSKKKNGKVSVYYTHLGMTYSSFRKDQRALFQSASTLKHPSLAMGCAFTHVHLGSSLMAPTPLSQPCAGLDHCW